MSTSSSQSSSRFLKELTEEAWTTCPGILFHELITLSLKKYFLSHSLHLFTFSFHLWSLIVWPTPLSNSKKSSMFIKSKPFTIRKTWTKSPLTLLFSKSWFKLTCISNRQINVMLHGKTGLRLVFLCCTLLMHVDTIQYNTIKLYWTVEHKANVYIIVRYKTIGSSDSELAIDRRSIDWSVTGPVSYASSHYEYYGFNKSALYKLNFATKLLRHIHCWLSHKFTMLF